MILTFTPLDREQALTIVNWRYPYPYDYYNLQQEELSYLLEETNAFFAISNQQGDLEGFCSFGSDGRVPGGNYSSEAVDIGMGIRPDLIGLGRGKYYVRAVARYGANKYRSKQLRVTIAFFNKRAQRVWQQLGFDFCEKFFKTDTEEEFIIMTRTVFLDKTQ